jgi:hypothetical protein
MNSLQVMRCSVISEWENPTASAKESADSDEMKIFRRRCGDRAE